MFQKTGSLIACSDLRSRPADHTNYQTASFARAGCSARVKRPLSAEIEPAFRHWIISPACIASLNLNCEQSLANHFKVMVVIYLFEHCNVVDYNELLKLLKDHLMDHK